jgi:enoyl-CoA hydratase
MSYDNIVLGGGDGIATVTVSRPEKLNALDARTLEELDGAFREIAAADEIRGVVVTGAGPKAFVAGADIGELSGLDAPGGRERARRGQSVFDRIEGLGKPVVAAVNGFALGGGCELALACHVRVAAETARLGTPEVKLGLMCGYGGTQRLARLVGSGRALEMLLSGDVVDAAHALRIGLVNRVVPAERLMPEAEDVLRRMTANAPLALRCTLEAVLGGLDAPLGKALEHEAALFGLLCSTSDAREGTRAFLEKRSPKFQGK